MVGKRRCRSSLRTGGALFLMMLTGLICWIVLAWPASIRAHALLVHSIPEANAELVEPPATIEMWFSEPLEAGFSRARLLNALGEEMPTGAVHLDPSAPTHMTLPLGDLEAGVYTVAWQTLSQADGHEWTGSFPLTILAADGSRPAAAAATIEDRKRDELPSFGEILTRWLVLLASVLFFGAPFFQLFVVSVKSDVSHPENSALESRAHDLVLGAIWLAVLAMVLGSLWQAALQSQRLGGLGQLPELLFSTRAGTLVLIRQILAFSGLFIILALPQPRPFKGREWPLSLLAALSVILFILPLAVIVGQDEPAIVLATVVVVGLGMSFVVTGEKGERRSWMSLLILAGFLLFSLSFGGHASAVPGSIWAVLGDFVHLLAAAVWVGGLVLLPLLIWQTRGVSSPAALHSLLIRFSFLAGLAVFILVTSGLFSSLVQLPDLASLLNTTYGQVLLVKLGVILLALLVAVLNRRLIHHHKVHLPQQPDRLKRLHRQVGLEAVFSLGLILSVAILVQTPSPAGFAPDTASAASGQIFNKIVQADDLTIHTQVLPNQVGHNQFLVHLYHADNSAIGEVQLVRLLFNHQEAQLGQARADLEPSGGNIFSGEGAYLSQAGPWELSIYVRRRGMDDVLAKINLEVPAAFSFESGETAGKNVWQNPIPAVPAPIVIAGVLTAIGIGSLILMQGSPDDHRLS